IAVGIHEPGTDKEARPRHGKPWWGIPYRCLYSRNIVNLFMAGRNISTTYWALGAVRVMRTCGLMGEVVGTAAAVCARHGCLPREVYKTYLGELKRLLGASST
ncbi:MAG TPA: FAD-dependent oxidoreductase, partial [Candidatus Latescibacteria bacterium]|nr:FAD-dependent oxidoreductase [Candidatus Latescibacterota bacterium]